VSAVDRLYGTTERVSDRMHSIETGTGDSSQRRRYAFVQDNVMVKQIESTLQTSAEKKKNRLSINKLQSNSTQASQSSKSQPRKQSVGEFNATKRISLEGRPSLGNRDGSRDSMKEARERHRRRSSGAEEQRIFHQKQSNK